MRLLTKQRGLLAIALALVAGAIAMRMWSEVDARDPIVAFTPSPSERRAPVLAEVTEGERAAAAVDDPSSEPSDPDEPVETAAHPKRLFGFVVGGVYDRDGEPLRNRTVLFSRVTGLERGARKNAKSNEEGIYRDKDTTGWRMPARVKLEIGTWYVFCTEENELLNPALGESNRLMGTVEVFEDQQSHFDVIFGGGRSLTGTIEYDEPTLADEEAVALQLQLLPLLGPQEVVGDGYVAISRSVPWFDLTIPEDRMRSILAKQGKEYPKWKMGAFCFSGLEPQPYVLRVTLDVKGLYTYEQEFDLSLGDVDAGPIVLTFESFRRRRGD